MKNWYDAKDIRSMGGNDVNFAMDAPKYDSADIALLREKGAQSGCKFLLLSQGKRGRQVCAGRVGHRNNCHVEMVRFSVTGEGDI